MFLIYLRLGNQMDNNQDIVSVIMSVYNESFDIVEKSINSILSQTYKKLQIIVINDNPKRLELDSFLRSLCSKDARVLYYKNKNNLGLVNSLNIGLHLTNANYIARMDADDISSSCRIEKQLNFLKNNNCDIVGSYVTTIGEDGKHLGQIIVPTKHSAIISGYNYGCCLLHPTWLAKKKVFTELEGYRNILACEDYDFVLRAINKGFILGNVPEFLLKYRLRASGISCSLEARQKLTTYFLKRNKDIINDLTISDFNSFFYSKKFSSDLVQMNRYISIKKKFRNISYRNFYKVFMLLCNLLINKFFYVSLFYYLRRNIIINAVDDNQD